jgi:hypothetical protein
MKKMDSSEIPANILESAASHIQGRTTTYDTPSGDRSMEKAVGMFNALLGGDRRLSTEQGWMFMAIVKMARTQQGDFRMDNYEDLAAYAALAAESAHTSRVTAARPEVVELGVDHCC